MRRVFMIADCIISPLGFGTEVNYNALLRGHSAIKTVKGSLSETEICAAVITENYDIEGLTRLESLAAKATAKAIEGVNLNKEKTVFILSTTKGNIGLLGKSETRLQLHASAKEIAAKLNFKNYTTVSNACISGVMAMLLGQRLIRAGKYDHAIVVGAEELSKFIVSGFQSLYAMSEKACRPFDEQRNGVSLGEAAAAVVLSLDPQTNGSPIEILSGSISNDANHISGPSRTGVELANAINATLRSGNLSPSDVDFISAHGTATLYNDEMEAKAFHHAGLGDAPVSSLKGFFGHTLGAAGVVETIITAKAMLKDELIPTAGFEKLGVSRELDIVNTIRKKIQRNVLKTASGFGGCNAALALGKNI